MKKILVLLLLWGPCYSYAQSTAEAKKLYQANKLEEAKEVLLALDDSDKDVPYFLGRIAFDQREFKKSVSYFEDLSDDYPNVADYHYWYGNALGRQAQESSVFRQGLLAPKIKNAYEKAVALDPKNIDAHLSLIEFYTLAPGIMGGSWEKAEETAEVIKSIDPAQGHTAMATVWIRQEEYDKAEKEYQQAMQLNSQYAFTLGYFYQGRKSFDKAFDLFQKVYAEDTTKIGALYQIGRTSAFSGTNSELGIASLENYLSKELPPNFPSPSAAWMRMAMIYEKKGDDQKAVELYTKSLALDENMEESKKGLERLR
ncbi:MAG: tetratricopeptide repeat protein [Cytophagales bacterium]|nr:tetratricopeptide repeat protein [Cytophagales bacterium]